MITFDPKKLKEVMINEEGYTESEYYFQLKVLERLDEKLQEPFDLWLYERKISTDFNVEGITLELIMKKHHCTFLSALATMNTYLNNTEKAKRFFTQPTHLVN
ncbi:hypothetical protein SAMN06265361_10430 [Laceyella tengchongensis]|uniref:Uncharacterized protein n=1 Tax=Laceyella tengchongensis TaxID=574699 RepID=A0AA46AFV2_9BACL|nr:hypothetical protein [Laceyella tengchongensis]SMP22282.1 hypothetical protein SAMN06265361_10430 [Laceyella tengchongensis]